MNVASRVARPNSSTSRPVANGSRVPRCPMLRSPYMRRTCWTTSCDVIPGGLSTSSSPSTTAEGSSLRSVVFPATRCGGVLLLHIGQQRFDASGASDGVVFLELDFGSDAELQLLRDARPQERSDAVEAIESRLLLGIATEHADVDSSVPEIGTYFGAGNGDEADDTRILCRFGEECRDLDADRFGDAVRSTRVTQMPQPLKPACALPVPSGSTPERRRP